MKFVRRFSQIALPLVLVAVFAAVAAACPTCREGLAENDPQGQSVAAGFYYSIIFMVTVPYATLAGLGGIAYLSIRRAKARQAIGEANVPLVDPAAVSMSTL